MISREGDALISLTRRVTQKWAKVRKAEERDWSRASRRGFYLTRPRRESAKDVAWEVMEQAYLKASANGTLPAHARQVYYAVQRADPGPDGAPARRQLLHPDPPARLYPGAP